MRVLNLGSGTDRAPQKLWPDAKHVTVDLDPDSGADYVADVRDLPDDLGMFDIIFSSHVLEHLPRLHVLPTVQQWVGHLRPGGHMHIFVPDLMWAAKEIASTEELSSTLMMHLYGGGQNELLVHRMGFTVRLLRDLLERVGLIVREAAVRPYDLVVTDADGEQTTTWPKQIYAVAFKPHEEGGGNA